MWHIICGLLLAHTDYQVPIVSHLYLKWHSTVQQYLGHIYVKFWHVMLTPRSASADYAVQLPKVVQICFKVFRPYLPYHMWATLGSHPDKPVLFCAIY